MSLLVAVMFASSLGAQDQSMLYAITGNGLTETSYLFGTIHLQCEADFIIKDKVKNALDACEQIYFEVDLTDPEIPVKVGAAMMNGPKLSEVLTEEESKKLDVVLQERLGYTVQIVDNFSIGMIAGLLSFTEIKCEDQKSYDGFKGQSAFSSWMYRVALNTAITFIKKEKRRVDRTELSTENDPAYDKLQQLILDVIAIAFE